MLGLLPSLIAFVCALVNVITNKRLAASYRFSFTDGNAWFAPEFHIIRFIRCEQVCPFL